DIEIITEEEKRQILYEFNDTAADYPKAKTIHRLFEEQVERTPDNIGLVGSRQLAVGKGETVGRPEFQSRQATAVTYRELNEKSNRLSQLLKSKGAEPGKIVAIMVERSIEMIIGLLGILKSGAAYLPIDPASPGERINYMLADSHTKILLTEVSNTIEQEKNTEEWKKKGIELIGFSELKKERVQVTEEKRRQPSSTLAYIIYTSGTTGKPKGVMIQHRSIVNTLTWRKNYYKFGEKDVVLQMASYTFDSSVEDIFTSLLSGTRLITLPREKRLNLDYLKTTILREAVSHLLSVPSLYQSLLNEIPDSLRGLDFVTVAGDGFTGELVRNHFEKLEHVKLFNEYGPTENSVCSTVYEFTPGGDRILIGKPINNVSCFITDKNSRLVPVGVVGELSLSGQNLSIGYLNNQELTAERFANNKLQITNYKQIPNNKKQKTKKEKIAGSLSPSFPNNRNPITDNHLYITGDLCRWLPDGNIEFLGRIDNQVKIRGFRIELGEIESCLSAHPGIKETVVIARKSTDDNTILCAYYVYNTAETTQQPESELKNHLTQYLPGYMIPNVFTNLEKLPLTPNGKVDRKALLEMPIPNTEVQIHIAPRNSIEKRLVRIWSNILGLPEGGIGIDEDFFDIGGHSLRATVMVSKIHKEFNVKLPLSEIFKRNSIRTLSETITECRQDKYDTIEPAEKKEYYNLSSAQKRLYVLQQMELKNTVYNMPQTIPLLKDTDPLRLEDMFKKLIRRHEILRTAFNLIDGKPVQIIHPHIPFKIETLRFDGSDSHRLTAAKEAFFRPFDLKQAPLLRVGLIKIKDTPTGQLLLLDMHHIITDGMSQDVMTKEFFRLYAGDVLSPLKLRYRDYSEWQNGAVYKRSMKKQGKYWSTLFAGELPVLGLPTDYPRPRVQSFEGSNISFVLDEEKTVNLKKAAGEKGLTPYMIILSAFTILLSKLSGQEDIIVGTPTAGRKHVELENIVGMFVNTLAMRNYTHGETSMEAFLREVRENTLNAFENQEYQFEDLVDRLSVPRDTARNPLFDVMLNLINQSQYKKQNQSPQSRSTTSTPSIPSTTSIPSDANGAEAHKTPDAVSTTPAAVGTSKFDLTLNAVEGEQLNLHLEYCTKLFKKATIKRFIAYFKEILQSVSAAPEQKIKEIEIITEKEKHQILYGFNDTTADYPKNKTIHQLFEEQAERTPDNIGLVGSRQLAVGKKKIKENEKIKNKKETTDAKKNATTEKTSSIQSIQLTYRELNEQSNRLAGLLKTRGVEPGSIVAIMADRSILTIIGLLGILKAGGAYLPIDPVFPRKRIRYMLADSNTKIVLSGEHTAAKQDPEAWSHPGIKTIELCKINELNKRSRGESCVPPTRVPTHVHPDHIHQESNAAYIIYTSGTTGAPKGVMIEHRGLVDYIWWAAQTYVKNENVNFPLYTSISFDLTVTSIFTPLITGNAVVVYGDVDNPLLLAEIVEDNLVGVLKLTPAHLRLLRDIRIENKNTASRRIIVGGEELETLLAKDIVRVFGGSIEIYNEYGPTETVVGSTIYKYDSLRDKSRTVPIGKPTANSLIYILDR
ncbi:MAG: amino acid adenylation domain-containing protein, partial [bacterium]|nr:amino acid adenylation domain-containing protein [bacterium]